MAGSESLPAEASGKVRMSFVMPSQYTKDTLPRPNDASVEIKEVPAHTVAALTFRGHVRGRKVVEERKQQLLQIMEAEGLVPQGNVVLNQYHPPFTYGWQRVNEVCFEVRE
ncbi:SOUL heme-binding protein [Monoraphidium neglectum]|uniref:SOUL heme-binding protein n=1 Tax=Monoraphidium neglectum TaxID=145388 RepID=A0A0D2JU95_9CHLO|nr:SOUL heme-binding protein [Monoraphidium neglectum]KIZ02468.1 SOUL heme-binding protein [Monoraphidium neglectum]|eukprot:XP_013901487.1 SOUL heme-binding protein [Monoraphidium neglectum]